MNNYHRSKLDFTSNSILKSFFKKAKKFFSAHNPMHSFKVKEFINSDLINKNSIFEVHKSRLHKIHKSPIMIKKNQTIHKDKNSIGSEIRLKKFYTENVYKRKKQRDYLIYKPQFEFNTYDKVEKHKGKLEASISNSLFDSQQKDILNQSSCEDYDENIIEEYNDKNELEYSKKFRSFRYQKNNNKSDNYQKETVLPSSSHLIGKEKHKSTLIAPFKATPESNDKILSNK